MEITGLDITLQRISYIEQQFRNLANIGEQKPDSNFQKILNSSMNTTKDGEIPDLSNASSASKSAYATNAINVANKKFGTHISKEEINALIEQYSEKNGLDADFVRAVVKQESGFNENATSRCGAMGLMQLMPWTAKGLGVTNAYDPEQNVAGGTKMLSNLLKTYGGDKQLALAAYNAGGGAVKKYGGIPPYKETQNYVKNVLSIYNRYKEES